MQPRAPEAVPRTCLLVVAGSVALFAALHGGLLAGGWLPQLDQALTEAIRRDVPLPVLRAFAQATVLADPATLWALAVGGVLVLLLRRQKGLALTWMVAIGGNGLLTRALKELFARQRPGYEHELLAVAGYSFPSGHASGGMAAYGALAYVLLRTAPPASHTAIVLVAIAVVALVGFSRVLLQVHFASDVLGGYALGLAWLASCIAVAEWGRSRPRIGPPPSRRNL